MSTLPVVGILLGDATGIGPELVAKMVQNGFLQSKCSAILIGDARVFTQAKELVGLTDEIESTTDPATAAKAAQAGRSPVVMDLGDLDPSTVNFGELSEASGRACLHQMDAAVSMCEKGLLGGFCYAPFNKAAMAMGGNDLPSELEYIARAFGLSGGFGEMNVVDGVWTTRVTSHIPIAAVSAAITVDSVLHGIHLAHETILKTGKTPRVGVSALNPHAGESGLCGREEIDVIEPAVAKAKAEGIDVYGPWSADTIFVRAYAGTLDAVVTMYHDQGQIALKVRGFDHGSTVNAGLPYPVTTCTHGTAYDIAGQGKAWTSALENAVRLLSEMA